MKFFNLQGMEVDEGKEKETKQQKVFYKTDIFKVRIIELAAGEQIPACNMDSWVIFTVLSGTVNINVNKKVVQLKAGECLITEPAVLSMKTEEGVRIMGVQIEGK